MSKEMETDKAQGKTTEAKATKVNPYANLTFEELVDGFEHASALLDDTLKLGAVYYWRIGAFLTPIKAELKAANPGTSTKVWAKWCQDRGRSTSWAYDTMQLYAEVDSEEDLKGKGYWEFQQERGLKSQSQRPRRERSLKRQLPRLDLRRVPGKRVTPRRPLDRSSGLLRPTTSLTISTPVLTMATSLTPVLTMVTSLTALSELPRKSPRS